MEQLGVQHPSASSPAAKYANAVMINVLLFVSGKGPSGNPRGKLGSSFSTEEEYAFAREAGFEILAALKETLGSLDQIKRVVKAQAQTDRIPS